MSIPSVLAYDKYDFSNYKFERADWHSINLALATIDRYSLFGVGVYIEDCWYGFCLVLHNVFDFYIPKKHVLRQSKYARGSAKKKTKRKIYSNKIRRAMSGKLRAWRKFKVYRPSAEQGKFDKCTEKLKHEIKKI